MSRQLVVVLGLVCLVGVAGCIGLTDSQATQSPTSNAGTDTLSPTETPTPPSTATPTPPPTPEPTPTPTETPRSTDTPSSSGDFGERLLANHGSAIVDRDYELERYQYREYDSSNRTWLTNRSVTLRSSIATERVVGSLTMTQVRGGIRNVSRLSVFATTEGTFRKQVSPAGDVQYSTSETSNFTDTHMISSQTVLDAIVRDATFERAGTVDRDGLPLTRYEVSGLEEVDPDTNVSGLTGYLLVGADDIVREAALSYTVTLSEGQTRTVAFYYELTPRDRLTVEKPGWVSEAKQSSEE